MMIGRGLSFRAAVGLLAVLLTLQACPVRPQWILPVRMSAADWGKLLVMRWSEFPTLQGRQATLSTDVLDAYVWAGSDFIENQLGPGDKALFIARYFAAKEANATALVMELEESPYIVPVRGCCQGVGHLLLFVSFSVKQQLQARTDLFQSVEAVPPQLKVEPSELGKLIEAADQGETFPGSEVALRVVIAQGAVQALYQAQAMAGVVRKLVGEDPGLEVLVQSFHALVVRPLTLAGAALLARTLATRPDIQWIEPFPYYETHNLYAEPVIQGPSPWTSTPYSSAGLTGRGETVSAADTGLDTQHCFFKDSQNGAPGALENQQQRKVVQYIPLTDSTDVPGGHGTHLMGTLLGQPESVPSETPSTDPYNGIAPDAKLVFLDIGNSQGYLAGVANRTLGNMMDEAQTSGSSLHLSAWGATLDSLPMSLNFDSWDVDRFLFEHEDFLLIVSAGNEGLHGLGGGNYTVSSPAISKNALTVGASLSQSQSFQKCHEECAGVCPSCERYPDPIQEDAANAAESDPAFVAPFSSRGPTLDGRIKPDLVAPGFRVWSADAFGSDHPEGGECRLTARQGTSSAAAVAAGAAALVRQYFVGGYHPSGRPDTQRTQVPSGALIKACLIHSAQHLAGYMTGVEHPTTLKIVNYQFRKFPQGYYPNTLEGWGLLRLDRVLPILVGEERYGPSRLWVRGGTQDQAVLQEGQKHTFRFSVASGEPFRVTLVWMDPPTMLGAAISTVNDLDLSILSPEDTTLYPNGLRSPDAANNVERIDVDTPTDGVYTVVVAGTTVFATNPQQYAMVVTGSFSEEGYGTVEPTPPKERPPSSCLFLDPDCVNGVCANVTTSPCPVLAGDVRSAGRGSGSHLGDGTGIFGPGWGSEPPSSTSAALPAPHPLLLALAAMATVAVLHWPR